MTEAYNYIMTLYKNFAVFISVKL